MSIPVYERKYYLNLLSDSEEEITDDTEEIIKKTGEKSRKKTFSGDTLKNKLRNDDIK